MFLRLCHWLVGFVYWRPLQRTLKTRPSGAKDKTTNSPRPRLTLKWTSRQMATALLLCVMALMTWAYGQECGGTFNASSGIISSPSYPFSYPNNQDCSYLINGPLGSRVTLKFAVFSLQDGVIGCNTDYVQIRDGCSQTSPLMATYCGATLPPVARSFSNCLHVRFVSDGSVSGAGFLASYIISVIPQQFMLVANTGLRAIQRIDIATISNIVLPLSGLLNPVAVDYDPMTNRVYWSDVAERTIQSANLDGSDKQVFFRLGPGAVPDGLAVDHLSGLLVFTDFGNSVISMVTLTTKKYKSIIKTAIEKPRDIELDKRNGVMYWSDWGTNPKIERANYDGTNRMTLVSGSEYIYWPNGLALDTAGERLYWADAYTDKIGWTSLDGTSRNVTFANPGSHFFGMELFQNNLYITDWGTAAYQANVSFIHRIDADGLSGRIILQSVGRMNDIVIVSDQMCENSIPNRCTDNNGGCNMTICIPAPVNSNKCLTSEAYVLPIPRSRRSVRQTDNDAFILRRDKRSVQANIEDSFVKPVIG